MDGVKSFLFSKTLWGLFIMVFGIVAPKLGLVPFTSGEASEVVAMFIDLIGLGWAIIGRFTAKKSLVVK